MRRPAILLTLFFIAAFPFGCGPKPWIDDYAEEPTDQVVWDLPIPAGFKWLSTRGFTEYDKRRGNRYVEAYYRGEKSPAVVAIELEREMVDKKHKWTATEKSGSGDKFTLRFRKNRAGGDNRFEECEIQVWKLEDFSFIMFKISPEEP
ncbi:MAG: hypothetical protein ACYS8W_02115 [Planctomycetota bacterium]